MTKRRIAALAVLLTALLAAQAIAEDAAATAAQAADMGSDSTDVVVLLDVSQSVLPYFQDVTDYVVTSVVKDYLRRGDTFHLLSFGETVQSELAQRMVGESDVNSVLGRLYLLYPIARYSDIAGALSYLYQYLADLPESRRKVVIVITDGMNNPPPSSPSYGADPAKVTASIENAAQKIRANGWPVHLIKLPFPKPAEPGAPASSNTEPQGQSYFDVAAKALGAEVAEFSPEGKSDIARRSLALPTVEFPGPLGKKDYAFSFPIKIRNQADSPVGLELDRVRLGDADVLSKRVFLKLQGGKSGGMDVPILVPESVPEGDSKLAVSLHFANGVRVSPDTSVLELTLHRSPVAALLRSGGRIALFIVVLALLVCAALALVLIVRRMPRRAEAPVVAAVLADSASSTASSAAISGVSASSVLAVGKKVAGKASPQAALASGAARASADEASRIAGADKSASDMAAGVRSAALQNAALLAQAATQAKGEAGAESAAALPPVASRRRGLWLRKADEREESAEASAADLVRQKREETERTLALLAEAAGKRSPARRASAEEEAKARAAAAAYAPRVVKPGSIQVEFTVSEQNPHIGSRNVHVLGAGGNKSVGGGASDFLVFLVSVPRKAAELHYDGEKLTFVPLRPELFPELSGPVEDCLGMDIPMISRSGYPLTLRFEVYEKPADRINKLLHCIETPGLIKG
jgi:hypothetical protein